LTKLLDFEQMNRVVFGADIRQRHSPRGDELYVAAVRPGTPAAGRLQKGDVLLALNGEALGQIPAYVCAMLTAKAGTKLRLKVRRAAKELEAQVAIRAKPRPDGKALAQRLFGMTLREVTPRLARELRLSVDRGLLVVGVDAGGPANRLGIQPKDVLFQVGRYFVRDLDGLGLILEKVEPGQAVKIGIVRRNVRALAAIRTRRRAPRRPDRGDEI
jgi:S1-C subfamily serine protease